MTAISLFQQPINPLATEICRLLQLAGHQAYIVGGCVRDLYLNLIPKDWDICSSATPQEVMDIFPRTIPTGLQHGTVTVCMGEGVENHFEVTTFRVEGEYLDGRRPEQVKFVNSITEDLARRDLTINAIAYDPVSNIGCDPFNGWQDIQDGIIRAVGNPIDRFQEDGLRIMRVARFAARFNYQVEPNTIQGMTDSIDTLRKVSKERVSDELCKTLMTNNPTHGLVLLANCGALQIVCPLLFTAKPVLVEKCQGDLETRLAFLYNEFLPLEVGKELIELKMSAREIKKVHFLLLTLKSFRFWQTEDYTLTYRHFLAEIKNMSPVPWEGMVEQFIALAEALDLPAQDMLDKYGTETVYAKNEMQIDGNDLIELGMEKGPKFKVLLELCYLEILREPKNNNKSYLIDLVKRNMEK